MIDRSDHLEADKGVLAKAPPAHVPCGCRRFRKAIGPDPGSYETKRSGVRVLRNGSRSASEEFCKCDHYAPQHELNGRCTARVWDLEALPPENYPEPEWVR